MTTAAFKLPPVPTVEGGQLLEDDESVDFVLLVSSIEFGERPEPPPVPARYLQPPRQRQPQAWWAADDSWSGWLKD